MYAHDAPTILVICAELTDAFALFTRSPTTKVVHVRLGEEESGVRLAIFVSPAYPHEIPPFELKGVNWKKHDQSALYEGKWSRACVQDTKHPTLTCRSTQWRVSVFLTLAVLSVNAGLVRVRETQEGGPFLYQWIDHIKEFLSSADEPYSSVAEVEEEEEPAEYDPESWKAHEKGGGAEADGAAEGEEEIEIIHGETLVDRKSVFQAHLARVHSEREAMRVLEVLKRDRKIARATHNMFAYRAMDVEKGAQVADNDDDGENAAGGKMAELLAMMGVNDVMVVVSRWYGGIQLGPDRFRHINNVARQILEQNGFERKAAAAKGPTSKPKR